MAKQHFAVTDAHGRLVTLTPVGQEPQAQAARAPRPQRRHASVAIAIARILTTGAVAVVLLIVARDIVLTLAGGGITSLVLQALLRLCHRKER